jgi:hypothetical protein
MTRRVVVKAGVATKVCQPPTAAEGCYGLRPEDLKAAYFHGESPESPAAAPLQTIALVDAYNDYAAEADLKVYDKEFELPEITRCKAGQISDCFEQVNQRGESAATNPPFPRDEEELVKTEDACLNGKSKETRAERTAREADCHQALEADGWAVEISTDIEVARGICQNCRVLLVEASSSGYPALEEAVETAVRAGATEVSNSWGGEEPPSDSAAFNHPGTVIAAAAGDDGYRNWTVAEAAEAEDESYFAGADYPASSPHVVAVGGTKLTLEDGARKSETVWNEDPDSEGGDQGAGGGGCSAIFDAPSWQRAVPDWSQVGCETKRAVADVAADADPYTGVAVYDSVPDLRTEEGAGGGEEVVRTPLGWWPIGGTSVASPIVASLYALSGGAQEVQYPAETLYSHLGGSSLFDVTSGGNGKCDGVYGKGCEGSLSSALDCGEGHLICNAASGYDGPTGVGAPNGLAAFERPVTGTPTEEQARIARELQRAGEERTAESRRVEREEEERREEEQKAKQEASSGAKEAPSGTGTPPGGSTSPVGSGSTASSGGATSSTGGGSGSQKSQQAKLLALSLTHAARIAMRGIGVLVDQVSFAFRLSAAARIDVELAHRARRQGHQVWQRMVRDSISFAARKGAGSRSLSAGRTLAPGRYRLTLAVRGGGSRSVVFTVR